PRGRCRRLGSMGAGRVLRAQARLRRSGVHGLRPGVGLGVGPMGPPGCGAAAEPLSTPADTVLDYAPRPVSFRAQKTGVGETGAFGAGFVGVLSGSAAAPQPGDSSGPGDTAPEPALPQAAVLKHSPPAAAIALTQGLEGLAHTPVSPVLSVRSSSIARPQDARRSERTFQVTA